MIAFLKGNFVKKTPARRDLLLRVSDGTRTRDRLDHNQELYLLSYAHHVPPGRAT